MRHAVIAHLASRCLIGGMALLPMLAPSPHAAAQERVSPRRALLAKAIADTQSRRFDAAMQSLQQLLGSNPQDVDALTLLGPIQRRLGDLYSAIRTYDRLVALTPEDADTRQTLERWKREAELHSRMRLAVGDFFTISFEGPEESAIAAAALNLLTEAYWRIGDVFGSLPAQSIAVVLYSGEQFRDVTRSPSWAAGVFDGTIRVPVRGALERPDELARVLAHEFTHAMIHSLAPHGVPMWLNEGLAAALERDDVGWAERRLARDGALPLGQLRRSFGRLSDEEAARAYATSAVAARRLLDLAGGVAIANLLRDLAAGQAFDDAFLGRIQQSFADFEASLR